MPTTTTNYSLIKPNVDDAVDEDLWGGYLNDDLDDIDAQLLIASVNPVAVGIVASYAGATAPSGWLLCYGQAVSRTTYAALFTAIGTLWGSGDGSTTFNVPDFRGRVLAGKDDMGGTSANRLTGLSGGVDGDVLGASGGAETHTLTEAQLSAHTHFMVAGVNGVNGVSPSPSNQIATNSSQANGNNDYILQGTASAAANGRTSSSGSGAAHNNVQPTSILNYIIYAGV